MTKISLSQIYITPEAYFPFSVYFQRAISSFLRTCAEPSEQWNAKYGEDWSVVINLSSKIDEDTSILGPSLFPSTRDVEYTLFVKHQVLENKSVTTNVVREILQSCFEILEKCHLILKRDENAEKEWILKIVNSEHMFRSRTL